MTVVMLFGEVDGCGLRMRRLNRPVEEVLQGNGCLELRFWLTSFPQRWLFPE